MKWWANQNITSNHTLIHLIDHGKIATQLSSKTALWEFTDQGSREVSTSLCGMFAFPSLAVQSLSLCPSWKPCIAGKPPDLDLVPQSDDHLHGRLLHHRPHQSYGSYCCTFPKGEEEKVQKSSIRMNVIIYVNADKYVNFFSKQPIFNIKILYLWSKTFNL